MEDVNAVPTIMPVDAIKTLMMLRAEMVQREARMTATIDAQVQSLRQEVVQFRREISAVVDGAGNRIALDAREAVSPLVAQYGSAVSGASAQLRNAGRTVWMWLAAAGASLLMVLIVGWALLGYYRRELAATKEELQRYEDAVPVVEAFYASDAVVCGGVICTNVDPGGSRAGGEGQYRAARQRPQR